MKTRRVIFLISLCLVLVPHIILADRTSTSPVSKPANRQQAACRTVVISSTRDGTKTQALFYAPTETPSQGAEAVPLLIVLHTWSGTYQQCLSYLPYARNRGWVMAAPNFRGPNKRPEACASEAAVQDVLDVVHYAQEHARVDAARIYLLGASGGGHMALMMAAKAPAIWAGVSAWVPVTDLAAWYGETRSANPQYAQMLEMVCGGPPNKQTQAEYHARSPLFHLAHAKGVAIDLNAGINDGHRGAVPISHSLRAFNALAEANDISAMQLGNTDIAFMCERQTVPPALATQREDDPERTKAVLFRRIAGPVRITVFDGAHEQEIAAALAWLSRQRKGQAADFTVHATNSPLPGDAADEVPR